MVPVVIITIIVVGLIVVVVVTVTFMIYWSTTGQYGKIIRRGWSSLKDGVIRR
jgi:uncharacterized protein YpmB